MIHLWDSFHLSPIFHLSFSLSSFFIFLSVFLSSRTLLSHPILSFLSRHFLFSLSLCSHLFPSPLSFFSQLHFQLKPIQTTKFHLIHTSSPSILPPPPQGIITLARSHQSFPSFLNGLLFLIRFLIYFVRKKTHIRLSSEKRSSITKKYSAVYKNSIFLCLLGFLQWGSFYGCKSIGRKWNWKKFIEPVEYKCIFWE